MNTRHLFFLILLAALWGVAKLPAQTPGSIDDRFQAADYSVAWSPLALQPDGKIIVGRDLNDFGVPLHLALARLNADGGYDSTFRPGRVVSYRTGDSVADGPVAAVQPDGKVLVAIRRGHLVLPDGKPVGLVRLQPGGELDFGFASVPAPFAPEDLLGRPGSLSKIVVQRDGGILLGLLRLKTDGTIDRSFKPPLTEIPGFFDTAIQADGRIIVGDGLNVIRLFADGSRDLMFPAVRTDGDVSRVETLADGKILFAGSYSDVNGIPRNRLARLHADGSLDGAFAPFSTGWTEVEVNSLTRQHDGKIIVAGRFLKQGASAPLVVVRLNTDGKLDENFRAEVASRRYNRDEIGELRVRSVSIQPNQDLLVAIDYFPLGGHFATETIRLRGDGLPYFWPHTLKHSTDGSIDVEIAAATNRTVIIEATTDLKSDSWTPLGSFLPAIDRGPLKFTDPDAARFSRRFYRARVLP